MAAGNVKDSVRVVIINTQYVETDAMSFKSVVQKLTGKNSTAAAAEAEAEFSGDERRRIQSDDTLSCMSSCAAPVLSRGMSFRDVDWLLKELPSLDELHMLYAEY